MDAAIYPGSFDPLTYGHLDVIKRGSKLFKKLILAISVNESKQYVFSEDERFEMITKATEGISGIEIEIFHGMIIDYARKKKINILLRGIRTVSDFEYEFQMALTNRQMASDIETIFIMPDQKYSFVSSRLTKEIASLGGVVEEFIPEFIAEKLRAKIARNK